MLNMFGFFNINKPAGCTSRDVVNQLQRRLRLKLGHAGTLDPLATGVLVVAVGKATRLIPYLQETTKAYRGTFFLGRYSDTEDIDGCVEEVEDPPVPAEQQIVEAAEKFVGEIEQVPPQYSALKVNGKRAYDLARKGQKVDLEARTVSVHGLDVVEYDYPRLVLDVTCGSGTYIRSLGRDLAIVCGTQAVMSNLVRTQVGPFVLDNAIDPDEVTKETASDFLTPAVAALQHLPQITIDQQCVKKLQHGQFIDRKLAQPAAELLAVDDQGRLIAIVKPREGDRLQPVRNFG